MPGPCVMLGALVLLLALMSAGHAASFVPGDWSADWSGPQAQVTPSDARTPDGNPVLRFVWTKPADATLPGIGRSFAPVKLEGQVATLWLRVDRPLKRLQVILTDGDDVGAEQAVPSLLRVPQLEPGVWHYVVWPFRANPGWVRYARGQVDWDRIKGIGFYTWPEELDGTITVEVGPVEVSTYGQLEQVFAEHPDRVRSNRGVPWRVLTEGRPDLMLVRDLARRAEARSARLHQRYPPPTLARERETVRQALAATYLLPPTDPHPESCLVGVTKVDGVTVERRYLRIAEGLYSTALVYLPYDPETEATPPKCSAILSLPGHGDPNWAAGNQERCLSLAKRGYLTMWVQPFGQMELGDNATWNEAHGGQSMAYLLTTGQSLLGLIMASHRAELTDLMARPDVDPERVGVTGISMGGTHTLWFAALETRSRANVAVSVAPIVRPDRCVSHHCLCDLMVGVFNVADEEMVQGVVAPRALMRIYPHGEVPLAAEGQKLYLEGWVGLEEALRKYGMDETALAERHRYTLDTFVAAGAPGAYEAAVVTGPHAYTPAMRERAGGWLDHFLRAREGIAPTPDPAVNAITDRIAATKALNIWSDVQRPAEVLSPTAYTQRQTAALVAKLPGPPSDRAQWDRQRAKLAGEVRKALGVDLRLPELAVEEVGRFMADGFVGRKLVVTPDPGIEVPMLLLAPSEEGNRAARLTVLLDPAGMATASASPRRLETLRRGEWVLCADLRGMGETRYSGESGGYMGFRDMDVCMGALKLGETLAGYWTRDLLCAIAAARRIVGEPVQVTVEGRQETGLVAVLAAGQSEAIAAVRAERLLASYHSAEGYGLTFAYSDESNSQAVRNRPLGGYGTMLPCIPGILRHADIPQLAALVAPRSLTLREPLWASGEPVAAGDLAGQFAWTCGVYGVCEAATRLRIMP